MSSVGASCLVPILPALLAELLTASTASAGASAAAPLFADDTPIEMTLELPKDRNSRRPFLSRGGRAPRGAGRAYPAALAVESDQKVVAAGVAAGAGEAAGQDAALEAGAQLALDYGLRT